MMFRSGLSLSLAALLLAFAGCASAPVKVDYLPTLPRFFLEQSGGGGLIATLPKSGVQVRIGAKPVFTEGDVVNVEIVQVELGKCLMFQFTPDGARDLYRVSTSNQSRRLVLFLNNVPLGARRMEGPISDGAVLVFVEVPDEDLTALADNLKKTTAAIQLAAKKH
jgi:hypothetical protein